MTKHKNETYTLSEIVAMMSEHERQPWYEIMDIEIPGLAEAFANCVETDDFTEANEIEADYLREHGDDWYTVMWPQHVTTPRLNGDASYHPALGRDAEEARDLQELCDWLNEDSLDPRTDMSSLPTFGGAEPEDTTAIFSWDETHLLIPTGGQPAWELEERQYVTLYKITRQSGIGYSLSPVPSCDVQQYAAYDDGGKEYELPYGYEEAESLYGDTFIYWGDAVCRIVPHSSGPPQLVHGGRTSPVLRPVED